MLVQKPGDEGGGKAHQRDRQDQAKHQNRRMILGRTGHGQHVVQAHRNVRDHDLGGGLPECLGRPPPRDAAVGIQILPGQRLFTALDLDTMPGPKFAPHLPADPQKQDTPGQQKPDDLQKLRRQPGKDDPQHRGRNDPHHNGLAPLLFRQARRSKTDHDGIVARQNQINADNGQKRGKALGGENL